VERVSVVFFTDHKAAETLGGLDLDVIAVLPIVRYHCRSRSVTDCDVYLGEFAHREWLKQLSLFQIPHLLFVPSA
jgi:hypothetical protein